MNQYLISNFAESEFKDMMFNVASVSSQKYVTNAYPKLRKIAEFKLPLNNIHKDKVIRYIMFLYDAKSPFRVKFNDILQRKVEVAKGAGWETDTGGLFDDNVESLLRGDNKNANQMAVAFIRLHRNFKYSYLIALEETFYRYLNETLMGNMTNVTKMKSTQAELEEIITELTNEDTNPSLRNELLRYVEESRLNLRPEDIARMAKKKQQEQIEE